MTSQRVRIACPSCQRTLQIRVENLGRRGLCRHCGYKFRAHVDDAEALTRTRRTGAAAAVRERETGKLEVRMGVLESELQTVLSHLANQSAQHASVLHELDETRSRLAQVQAVVDQAREQYREAIPEAGEDQARGTPHERLRSEISALRDRALEAKRLEDELLAERTRSRQLQAQLLEIQSHGGVLAYPEGDPSRAGLEVGSDFDFAGETDSLLGPGPGDLIAGSPGGSVEFRSELDELDRTGGDPVDPEPIEAEPAARAEELERLRSRLSELEPAFEDTRAQLERDRAAWEAERREIEARWEQRHRAALAEAEIRAADHRRVVEDLHQADDDRTGECRRLTAEADALKRVARRLRRRLARRDQDRAGLKDALVQAREQWNAERLEWQAQAEHRYEQGIEAARSEAAGHHHAELQSRIADQQAAIEEAHRSAREADEALRALQAQLDAARNQLADTDRERETLVARLEQAEDQTRRGLQQAEARQVEQQAAIEEERCALQDRIEALTSQLAAARQELRRQAEDAAREREALVARLEQVEDQTRCDRQQAEALQAEQQAAIEEERRELQAQLDAARNQLADAAREREALVARLEQAEDQTRDGLQQAEALQAEIEALRRNREHADQEHASALAALCAETEDERRRWTERGEEVERLQGELEHARRERDDALHHECDRRANSLDGRGDEIAEEHGDGTESEERQTIRRLAAVLKQLSTAQILTNQRKNELIAQVTVLRNALASSTSGGEAEQALRPRPRSEWFTDPEEYRADLTRWLFEAQQRQHQAGTQIDHLESELGPARHELELLNRDLALGTWDLEDEVVAEIALPFEHE